jgi:hypothetical protein
VNKRPQSVGTILLVIFFAAGAGVSGKFLEPIWRLKPEARLQFQEIGSLASIALMAVVGAACSLAVVGLARNGEWGGRLAIGFLIVNLVGDCSTLSFGMIRRRLSVSRLAG